jgi:hypothetical protein
MPSELSWIDFSSEDKNSMLNVIDMFREQDTRDELGIASIRDAYSDFFFPGTTTIQTRAKYMLFIPWIYRRIEEKYNTPSNIAEKARNDEIQLVNCLKNNNQTEGLIGMYAGAALQRLPSSIYWYGLLSWGIRMFPGSVDEYHRYIPMYRRKTAASQAHREEQGELIQPNWHPGIPLPPDDFPDSASFELTAEEAEYLRERIAAAHEDSLLARMVMHREITDAGSLWEHPSAAAAPEELKIEIGRGRCFAEAVHGAALLYNYMLAEKKNDEEKLEKFHGRIARWTGTVGERLGELQAWAENLGTLWETEPLRHRRIPYFSK